MSIEPDDAQDNIDALHIEQAIATRGFELIAERIMLIREHEIAKLMTAELVEVPRLQASIATLNIVLAVPERLLVEIRSSF